MIDNLLSLIAPHYCCSCGEIGSLLCESCKYNIVEEDILGCLICGNLAGRSGVCLGCRHSVGQAWCGGERSGGLEELIDRYKFEHAKAAFKPLGDLLLARLPVLPAETVIVPIPTVRSHIRQRGYDHTLLVAQYVAKRRGLTVFSHLKRVNTSMQRGASRKRRIDQAKAAFEVRTELQKGVTYLLIDDVVTTGATMTHAAKAMHRAGATIVWAGAVARQPLD